MSRRQCFYVDATMNPDGQGYIPALVIEGDPGFHPMGDPASDGITSPLPWRWGSTIEEAKATCRRVNAERGIDPEQVSEIVVSSIVASRRVR